MKFRDMDSSHRRRFCITFFLYVIVGTLVLIYFAATLYAEKLHTSENWGDYLQDSPEQAALAEGRCEDAAEVAVGTYVENIRELDFKGSSYRVEFLVWFNWDGDMALDPARNFRVYKGLEHSRTMLAEVHEGDSHYQLLSMDVSVSKNFNTKRFPLESQQLHFYVESTNPIEYVVFRADRENSGMNENLSLSGYEFVRNDIGAVTHVYDSTHGDPRLQSSEMSSEIVTAIEINRADMGLYFKCFIALAGTVTWVLITLFICTYHHVDPLAMVPAALFGTVSNIMVGASLLPDALEMGLLEYVNLWGVMSILGGAVAIININHVRKQDKDKEYARYYGRMLFYVMLFFSIGGQVVLPLVSYIR